MKFWDQQEFMHFITWHKEQGTEKELAWFPSAYPRAFFYLGFLHVAQQRYEEAVEFLRKGQALEPTNPKFACEMGHALSCIGEYERALEVYASVGEVGPHVSQADRGRAMRGRGSVLLQAGQLDAAEAAYRAALALEPDNEVARNELGYIEHLHAGGPASEPISSATGAQDAGRCVVCGQEVGEGRLITDDGKPAVICKRCDGRAAKRWWQFWR